MERLALDNQDLILEREHVDRYRYIAPLVEGKTIDIACGVGYGSHVLNKYSSIKRYFGYDIDSNAIQSAKNRFTNSSTYFSEGDITSLQIEDNSFDTSISFETLEHLDEPEKAVDEIHRVLKRHGLWIGSVPVEQFDNQCEKVYGKNPYHVTRFNYSKLDRLLSKRFQFVDISFNYLGIGSMFIRGDSRNVELVDPEISANEFLGSLVFLATNSKRRQAAFNRLESSMMYISSVVEYDKSRVTPIRKAFEDSQALVIERTNTFHEAEKMIDDRDKLIKVQERMIKDLESRINIIQKWGG